MSLNDKKLYSPGIIADLAAVMYQWDKRGKERKRVLQALTDRLRRHEFSPEGDGVVPGKDLEGCPAWFGSRWKDSVKQGRCRPGRKRSRQAPEPRRERLRGLRDLVPWLKKINFTKPDPTSIVGLRQKLTPGRLVLFFACLGLLAGFASLVGDFSRLTEGYRILYSEGPAAAYRYFTDMDSDEMVIGKGWAAFRNSKPLEARDIAKKIILSNTRHKGDALYLLAYVEFYSGNIDTAHNYFLESFSFYESQGNKEGIFFTYVGLARTSIQKSINGEINLGTAKQYLEDALKYRNPDATWFGLTARIEFLKGHYENAIQVNEESIKSFPENPSLKGHAFSEIGFLYLIQGDYQLSTEYTRRADTISHQINDLDLYYYNMINDYLILKCQNIVQEFLLEEVRNYFESFTDPFLLYFIDFSYQFQCAEDNIK